MDNLRIGQGIDFHRLEPGLELWLGGINVPSEKGPVAHSDGDVLLHAICDALLGAAGLKDIGYYFPDTDPVFRNIDSTICLERPKIKDYVQEMKNTISSIIETHPEKISIKATTTERMGFIGQEEGIAAFAVVLLKS